MCISDGVGSVSQLTHVLYKGARARFHDFLQLHEVLISFSLVVGTIKNRCGREKKKEKRKRKNREEQHFQLIHRLSDIAMNSHTLAANPLV